MTQVNEFIKVIGEFDTNSLLNEYRRLESQLGWLENGLLGKQCSLQNREGGEPFISGTGSIPLGNDIKEFHILNDVFKGTVFEELITTYKMYRTRFMWVNARACYKPHKDDSPRIHFPLVTNTFARFYFPDLTTDHMTHLEAGKIYWVDTTKQHSFINFGDSSRLHLVGAIDNDTHF